MHIAVYAFDGITMFHLSIPQIVFRTVQQMGLADWRVSLFTLDSGQTAPAGSTADYTESTSPTPSWYRRGSPTGAPQDEACARCWRRRTLGAPASSACAWGRFHWPRPVS